MNKRKGLIRTLSLSAAFCITVAAVNGSGDKMQTASAYYDDYSGGYEYGGYTDQGSYGDWTPDYSGDWAGDYSGDWTGDYSGNYSGDWTDPSTQWTDPSTQWTDPSTQWTDPNTQWTDPNTQTVTDPGASTSSQTDDSSSSAENPTSPDDVYTPLNVTDVSEYAEKLRDIIGKESELKIEISDADTALREEAKMLKSIKKRTDELDNELYILNKSMSALELQVGSNKREMDRLNEKIEDGTERLKKRMRALYLSGSDSYTTVLLQSDSFYDVLMRMELIKRVAEHDDNIIDELYGLQEQYEIKQASLDAQQAELDKQYALFDEKKAKLDEIYNSSAQARVLLEEKQKKLKEQEAQFNLEKLKAAQELGTVLKQPMGNLPFDQEVAATMELANARLDELHEDIRERIRNDEEIPEDEPRYEFAWPVPQCYQINSGVGARWGTYHKGIDIGGDHGYEIHASETGTVIMTNTTCPHDYGKYESCGCGGGYGNYIIIDHGNDFITLYGHLSEVKVEVGDQVKQGDLIGLMGSTGYSTGDHLHFEIRYQGYVLNPTYYVDLSIDSNGGGRKESESEKGHSKAGEGLVVVTDKKDESSKEEKHDESSADENSKSESSGE